MVRLTVLGSGSSGNCAVVSTGETTLLIDAGLSAKQICLRLASAGLSIDQLDGILLTHEHQDHTGGLEVLSSKRSLSIFATALTQESVAGSFKFRTPPSWHIMPTGSPFTFRDLQIECFSVPHDAVDPVGFVIVDEESRLGVLSDVGHVTNLIRERLTNSDSLFIEANYDAHLLEADIKRPWPTKQRISSRHGHLSNDQAAELLEAVAHPGLHHVLLGHLSDDCNDPDRVVRRMQESLHKVGVKDTKVICAERHRPTATVEVARRRVTVSFCVSPGAPAASQQLALF